MQCQCVILVRGHKNTKRSHDVQMALILMPTIDGAILTKRYNYTRRLPPVPVSQPPQKQDAHTRVILVRRSQKLQQYRYYLEMRYY
jgi:hypothetical protein